MNIRRLKGFVTKKINAELSPNLTYHTLYHTLEVLRVCNAYIRRLKITGHDAMLLRTAALLHDIGFLWTYADHEKQGTLIARQILPQWGYHEEDIAIICNLIMATKIPQSPQNQLEMIICDADLDYLGTDKFYTIGDTLFQELINFKFISDKDEWNKIQINFLNTHQYHTEYAKKYREPVKRKYLAEIMQK
jgi:uncharacterized protein